MAEINAMSAEEKTQLETYLNTVLDLEEIDIDLYRGYTPQSADTGRVFGGQTISQSLGAAYRSVEPPLGIHSLHSYFLRPGNKTIPILYHVKRLRDGRAFASRRVIATQSGKPIFAMMASFHIPEEGWEHQDPPPVVKSPESLLPMRQLQTMYAQQKQLPESLKTRLRNLYDVPFPYEIKDCDTNVIENALSGKKLPPVKNFWIRTVGNLGDDLRLHHCALAYLSSLNFQNTALRPHGKSSLLEDVQESLSLDHAMWFHHPFRADEFLLYSITSPRSVNALGLSIGHLYQDGKLVVTCAEEGLIRPRVIPPRKSQIIATNKDKKNSKL